MKFIDLAISGDRLVRGARGFFVEMEEPMELPRKIVGDANEDSGDSGERFVFVNLVLPRL